MKVVKFPLKPYHKQVLAIPAGSTILSATFECDDPLESDGGLALWVLVSSDAYTRAVTIIISIEDQEIKSDCKLTHVDSVKGVGATYHVFVEGSPLET